MTRTLNNFQISKRDQAYHSFLRRHRSYYTAAQHEYHNTTLPTKKGVWMEGRAVGDALLKFDPVSCTYWFPGML